MYESKRVRQLGFTLIELLIVVAIIGILAAVAIPNLMTAMQRSRQKRTMAEMRQIAMAWEIYETEHERYVPAGYSALPVSIPTGELEVQLEPTYIRSLPTEDGWGREFVFSVDARGMGGKHYQIVSYARDGEPQEGVVGPTTSFDDDIVYEHGSFVTFPANIQ